MRKLVAVALAILSLSCSSTGTQQESAGRYARVLAVAGEELRSMSTLVESAETRGLLLSIADATDAIEAFLVDVELGKLAMDDAGAAGLAVMDAISPTIDRLLVDANNDVRVIVVGSRAAIRSALAFLSSPLPPPPTEEPPPSP